MTRVQPRASVGAAAIGLAMLGGCDTDGSHPAAQATPSAGAVATSQGAVPDELHGHWMTRLSRADLRRDLKAAGFGQHAGRYIAAEDAELGYLFVLTLDEDGFNLAYFEEDQTWYVGWTGAATDVNGVLSLTDDFSSIVDSYTWTVSRNQLTLDFTSTTGGLLHGLPSEAYSHAHFSRPLTAVACGPAELGPPPNGRTWKAAADDVEAQLTTCT
jgi:hypothetical protein